MSSIKIYESRYSDGFLCLGGLPLIFLCIDFFTSSVFSNDVYILLFIVCFFLLMVGFLHKRRNVIVVTADTIRYSDVVINIELIYRIELVKESEIYNAIKLSTSEQCLLLSGFKIEKILNALFLFNYYLRPVQLKN